MEQKGRKLEKLKPCPFCGEAEDFDYGYYTGTLKGYEYIQCQQCGAEIRCRIEGGFLTTAEKLWNRRTYQPEEIEKEFMRICEAQMEEES